MTYDEWEASVPEAISQDPLWNMIVYRKALFLGDIAWPDVTRLVKDPRTISLADQLYRAVGSIGGWYWKARHVLREGVTEHRVGLLSEIIRLLLAMIHHRRETTFG